MSFFSNLSVAQSITYPNLADGNITSNNYEIVKIIDGKVRGVMYEPKSQQLFINADSHVWRIDNHGQVIDTFESHTHWYSSGYYFSKNYYNDWVLTGERQDKKYNEHIDASQFKDKQLFQLLDQADIVEFDFSSDSAFAYLITGKKSTIIEIPHKRKAVNRSGDDERYKDMAWSQSSMTGYTKKYQDRFTPVNPDWVGAAYAEDVDAPLTVSGFKKRKYYLEEGLGGQIMAPIIFPFFGGSWNNLPDRYWFGDALVDFKINDETLFFRVFADKQSKDQSGKRLVNFYNFVVYDFPNQPDVKLLKYKYLPYRYSGTPDNLNHYYEKNVGFYLVRKKSLSSPNQKYPQPWFIHTEGLETQEEVWGHVSFVDPKINAQFYQIGQRDMHEYVVTNNAAAAPQPFYYLPKQISVNVKTKHYRCVFQLTSIKQDTHWFHNPEDYTDLIFEIVFDQDELAAIVKSLTKKQSNKKTKTPININVVFEQVTDISASLKVLLEFKGKTVELTQYSITTHLPDTPRIKRAKLKALNEAVTYGHANLETLMSSIHDLTKTDEYEKEYAAYATQYIAIQINNHALSREFESILALFQLYVDDLLPLLNKQTAQDSTLYNHSVIASQSLVAAMEQKQPATIDCVFDKMFEKNFDVTTFENGVLVYNIACYYALVENKPALLVAAKRSRQLGHLAEQFLDDSDFALFLEDEAFLNTINAQYEPAVDPHKNKNYTIDENKNEKNDL
ncbi:hypothetical protein [Marinicellulosiphila megalodicopiae]|uniref:hypothetical protein n=1 Tax=Marinicellulosiphila megalodicopiae TaxID=2724896 RepID=UPI003BAF8BE1